MKKLYYWSLKMPFWLFFFISMISIILTLYIFDQLRIYNVVWVKSNQPTPIDILFAIILAPFIETFVNQYVFYFIFREVRKIPSFWLIIISAIVFGLFHFYSILHIFRAFTVGFVFMFKYVCRIIPNWDSHYLFLYIDS